MAVMHRTFAWWLLLAATLSAGHVHAQEEGEVEGEGIFGESDEPFVRTRDTRTDLCLWWEKRNYLYNLDAAGNAATPDTTELTAIDESFQSWVTLSKSCSDFNFVKGPNVTTVLVGYNAQSPDNTNVITFREKDCNVVVALDDACWDDKSCGNKYGCWQHQARTIALTTTSFQRRTGIIFDADIEINAGTRADGSRFLFTTVTSPVCPDGGDAVNCVATDVQNTLTHEIGHVVGLDHTIVPGSTMEAAAPPGELQKRIIDNGTAQGFCSMYPKGRSTPPCEPSDSSAGGLQRGVFARGFSKGCSATAGGLGPVALSALVLALRRRRIRKVCSDRS